MFPAQIIIAFMGSPKLNHSSTSELLSLQIFLSSPASTPLAPKLESSLAFYIETSIKQNAIVLPIYLYKATILPLLDYCFPKDD